MGRLANDWARGHGDRVKFDAEGARLAAMPDRSRIIKHEAVPDSGSFEVRFGDGRASKFFYWDDVPARRLRPEIPTSVVALVQAKAFARAMSDKEDAR